MATLLNPKEIAAKYETDARTVRKFLRATLPDEAPGKGSRWMLEARRVNSLKRQFNDWNDARTADSDIDSEDA